MFRFCRRVFSAAAIMAIAALALSAAAQAAGGAPEPWGLGFQAPASPYKEHIEEFHNMLLVIITVIVVFVLGLLVYVIVRFNARANPVPSKTAHNTMIEIVWTVVPVIILIVIAIPSFKLLYYGDTIPTPDLTIKAVGHQWYWSYEYPDHGDVTFDSRPLWDGPATSDQQALELAHEYAPGWLIPTEKPLRLLEVDNRIVLPVGQNVRVQTTATDVLHSWAMPALGVKRDSVPGRLNETWLKIDHEGIFYGQCSELCGTGHGFMPIVIEAVSPERFAAWIKSKQDVAEAPAGDNAKQLAKAR
ncbi:MAG: cytochrome c oxidase subunit II [Alphaproteobacteria bacterium]|nr:cytochrome c oxidase subunit II [Alphaproteobacteria bacterium]